MDGLIEIIFERVPDGAVVKLVNDLLQGAGIYELAHSELGNLNPELSKDLIPLLKQEEQPTSIFLRAACATIGSVLIRNSLIRVLRFEGLNEVAVIFDNADLDTTDRQDVVTRLEAGTKVLADAAGIYEYYCGFEPAIDVQTQLFSSEKNSPFAAID